MNRNVLITGGAGFIGSRLAIKLLRLGYHVTVLDNLSKQVHGDDPGMSFTYNQIKGQVNFIKGDVRHEEDWKKAIKNNQLIIHLAAETGTGQSMYEIAKYVGVNETGTALLLNILANQKHNVSKILFASSRSIYGEGKYMCTMHNTVYPDSRIEEDLLNGHFECRCPICKSFVSVLPTDENSAVKPISIYAVTKYNQEQLIFTACLPLGVSAIGFRLQNVYGPGQSLNNPYTGILSIFSTLIKQRKEINVFEDGMESRDFVYIDDVVEAIYSGIKSENVKYGIFNVGTGIALNVIDVLENLSANYNIPVKYRVSGNFRFGDIRHNYACISKIKSELDFTPRVNFKEGINKFTDWVNSQGIAEDKYENSIKEMAKKGLIK